MARRKVAEYTEREIERMISELPRPWDKIPVEPDASYRAFSQFYLRMPSKERSIKMAYYKHLEALGRVPHDRAPQNWYKWSGKFQWEKRAEAYDMFLEEETKNYVLNDQFKELADFRRRQRTLASHTADVSLLLIKKAMVALEALDPEDITPSNIPNFIKVAAQVAEMAQNAEAGAMMLNEIIQRLDIEASDEIEVQRGKDLIEQFSSPEQDTGVLFDLLEEYDI